MCISSYCVLFLDIRRKNYRRKNKQTTSSREKLLFLLHYFFSSVFLMAMLTGFSDVTLCFITWLLQNCLQLLFLQLLELLLFRTSLSPGLLWNRYMLQIPHYQRSLLSGSHACSIFIFLEASCRNCRSIKVKSYQLGLVMWKLDVVTVRSVSDAYLSREGKKNKWFGCLRSRAHSGHKTLGM